MTMHLIASLEPPEKSENSRTIKGLVVPWEEIGYTSAARLKVKKDSITIPSDLKRVKLLRDHSNVDGFAPVGYATAARSTDKGLEMTFKIGETADGDKALVDVQEGIRDALSVELIETRTSGDALTRSEEHTSELQSRFDIVCRL